MTITVACGGRIDSALLHSKHPSHLESFISGSFPTCSGAMSSKTPLSDPLTVQEKLLLSQAVYKLGAFSWAEVSSLLLDHPCIKDAAPHARPAKLFTPERCEGIYKELMNVIGINV